MGCSVICHSSAQQTVENPFNMYHRSTTSAETHINPPAVETLFVTAMLYAVAALNDLQHSPHVGSISKGNSLDTDVQHRYAKICKHSGKGSVVNTADLDFEISARERYTYFSVWEVR